MPARKKADIPVEAFQEAGRLYLTEADLGALFGVSGSRISQLLKDPANRAAWEMGRAEVRRSLRRVNIEGALNGNTTLAIWCAKNILSWTDRVDTRADVNTKPSTQVRYIAVWGGPQPSDKRTIDGETGDALRMLEPAEYDV